jgi:hypothetical protein
VSRWRNAYTYCDSYGDINSNSYGDSDCEFANPDCYCYSNSYCYGNSYCYSNRNCDRSTTGYTDATASTDTAAPTVATPARAKNFAIGEV